MPGTQLGSPEELLWANVLECALHQLAEAEDPVLPWLAQETTEPTSPLYSGSFGGLHTEQVHPVFRHDHQCATALPTAGNSADRLHVLRHTSAVLFLVHR